MEQLLSSPVLALLGALLVLLIIAVPLALRLAGLSGKQIVEVITLTLQFLVNFAQSLRDDNRANKQ